MRQEIIDLIEENRAKFWYEISENEMIEPTNEELEQMNKIDNELVDDLIKLFNNEYLNKNIN